MNPVRRRRLLLVGLLFAAALVAGGLVVFALQQNMTYLYSPSQVDAGEAPVDGRFRLGGVVLEDSVQRDTGTLKVRFTTTDRIHDTPVAYEGILPDLFAEGTSVIATGRMVDGVFVAEEVLAKHDETYMPKEVADSIAAAQQARAEAETATPAAAPDAAEAAAPAGEEPAAGGAY
jgi:cytochrome c-type biogenesis protein CcmE